MKHDRWTQSQVEYLKEHYVHGDVDAICAHLGETRMRTMGKANKLGLKRDVQASNDAKSRGHKKRSVNEDFFKTPSPDREYILGFIAADGCVEDLGRIKRLCIEIHTDETYLLQWICDTLESDYKISQSSTYNTIGTAIYNVPLVESLMDLGIHPRKSLGLEWVNVSNEYFNHFVRGYFDGDGGFHMHKRNKKLTANLVGTKVFLDRLTAMLVSIGLNPHKVGVLKNGITARTGFWGDSAIEFGHFLYDSGGFKATRKYSIWVAQTQRGGL